MKTGDKCPKCKTGNMNSDCLKRISDGKLAVRVSAYVTMTNVEIVGSKL